MLNLNHGEYVIEIERVTRDFAWGIIRDRNGNILTDDDEYSDIATPLIAAPRMHRIRFAFPLLTARDSALQSR